MVLHDRDGKARCEITDPAKALLLSAKRYRLYLASTVKLSDDASSAKSVILRLASERSDNGIINAEAELLKRVQEQSELIEESVCRRCEPPIHYDWLVPQLEATFIAEKSQEGRQASLLSFLDIAAAELFPLPKLKSYCMIDCKTAAWILGRYFKLQSFLDLSWRWISLDLNQVLISPSKHRLIYIGFIQAQPDTNMSAANWLAEHNVITAASDILSWIEPEQLHQEPEFSQLLRDFAEHGRKSGAKAHGDLYAWIDGAWGIKYHPFTYFVKSEQVWKHDNALIL